MTHLMNEVRILLTDLARREDVDTSTVWRWTKRGVRGVTLESFARGGRRFTTLEAFARWCEAVTAAATGEGIPSQTPRRQKQAIERAERRAEELGL